MAREYEIPLSESSYGDQNIFFSLDGSRILVLERGGGNAKIHVINLDTDQQQTIPYDVSRKDKKVSPHVWWQDNTTVGYIDLQTGKPKYISVN